MVRLPSVVDKLNKIKKLFAALVGVKIMTLYEFLCHSIEKLVYHAMSLGRLLCIYVLLWNLCSLWVKIIRHPSYLKEWLAILIRIINMMAISISKPLRYINVEIL